MRIAFCLEEERGALRLFLRALRRLPLELAWEAAVWLPDGDEVRDRAPAARPGPRRRPARGVARGADRRRRRRLRRLRRALAGAGAGAQALASGRSRSPRSLPLYEELTGDGERGLLFPPGDASPWPASSSG